MSRLRVGIVGAGHLGKIHARIATQRPEIDLVAIADPDRQTRTELSEYAPRLVANYRDFVDDIDAAIVAAPTTLHHRIGADLLRADIPLFIEKPLASNSAQANELVQLARQRQLVLQVGHVERFNPALSQVAASVGDPKYIEAHRLSNYSFRSTDIGVVLDLMIHDIDVVLSLVRSPVVAVQAMGIAVLGEHEDMANARLTFADGCVANLTASRISYAARRTMNIVNSRRFAALDFADGQATVVEPTPEILRRGFNLAGLTSADTQQLKESLFTDLLVRRDLPKESVNAIEEEQRDFVRAVTQGVQPRVSGAAGRDAVAVAENILAEIADHSWDGAAAARRGPHAMPALPLPADSDFRSPVTNMQPRRQAG